jgi:hypothetical protein
MYALLRFAADWPTAALFFLFVVLNMSAVLTESVARMSA